MVRIMLIFGTRPEAIKLSPVIRALENTDWADVTVCVTAQHREMLDQFLEAFDLTIHHDLNIMEQEQSPTDVTARVIMGLQDIFETKKPDIILVQGDTTTVFAASLAAFYEDIKIAHVEAGLRTLDRKNPFPEEINRRLTGVLADIHFAPTKKSKSNLLAEGVNENAVFVTGNTVIDALFWALDITNKRSFSEVQLLKEWFFEHIEEKRFILITAHRRESFGQPFRDICSAIKELAHKYPETHFIYPVHLNPNVRKPVYEILSTSENVDLIEPLSYLPFVWLMNRSYLILTDSGGIQEEAPSLGKPVLVMRETTERPEGIQSGTSLLVGRDKDKIITTVQSFLNNKDLYQKVARIANPYGDGKASERIANILYEHFGHE